MALTKVSPDLLDLDSGITITTTDNSDNLTLTSTDADASVGPNLVLYRNSSSPADNDLLGQIKIVGRNDNSQDVDAFYIQNYMTDVSDGSEDAASFFYLMDGGAARERVGFSSTATVFNEDSRDVDFRVESDGNANMLYVDGGKNSVGIGIEPEAHYTGYVGLDIGAVASLFSNASGTNITTLTNNGFLNSDASNWVYKVTDEATMYSQVHGDHRFSTAASGSADAAISWLEKMRLTSDGELGIGETDPDSLLHIKNTTTDGVAGISLENDARRYAINVHGGLSDGLAIYNAGAGETQFFISAAGNVGIGADNTSPDSLLSIKDATSDPILTVHKNATGANDAMRVQHGRGLSGFTGKGITFRRNDGTEVGNVTIGFSSTAFNTSSDYRLKENITYTWDATTRLKQLKPARFTFKDDTSDLVDGFLAHEVSSIVPEAINGEKDAVDSEGNPEYQSIDQSKLVPLLVKTIQEMEARITALES